MFTAKQTLKTSKNKKLKIRITDKEEEIIMSLTGKEIAQMHKDYVMQSWSKSGIDALPVERAEGIYFYDYFWRHHYFGPDV